MAVAGCDLHYLVLPRARSGDAAQFSVHVGDWSGYLARGDHWVWLSGLLHRAEIHARLKCPEHLHVRSVVRPPTAVILEKLVCANVEGCFAALHYVHSRRFSLGTGVPEA